MKRIQLYTLIVLMGGLLSCQSDKTVDFSYLPKSPRAGEKISFSNLTDEGEEWNWDFGDGGTSTSQSPTKIYKEAGTYTVTLKVDDKKYRTRIHEITVLDTVPTLTCSVDTIPYFETVTLSVDFYNPKGEEVKYAWTLPENAVVDTNYLTSKSVPAYFTTKNTEITVSLALTIGEKTQTLQGTYFVCDNPAPALLYATKTGELMRQRFYTNGNETPVTLQLGQSFANITSLIVEGNNLFILGEGIHETNLLNNKTITLNTDARPLGGYLSKPYLYWHTSDMIHYLQTTTTTLDRTLATTAQLTGFPHTQIQAVATYSTLYLVAGEKGIYRFTDSDINSGKAPATEAILQDKNISHLVVDEIARKLYFVANHALYVSNIDGSNTNQLAEGVSAITIHNASNRLYFATAAGISYLPLVQTPNNTTTAQPTLINNTANVITIAVDPTER